MSKMIIESPELPDIDKQIQYIKHLRKEVIPWTFQTELSMIFAIEQSLMAAKIFATSQTGKTCPEIKDSPTDVQCTEILSSANINLTSIRISVLKAILARRSQEFTVSEIHTDISQNNLVSKSAVISTFTLFTDKGLIGKKNREYKKIRSGRPEAKFIYTSVAPDKLPE